MLNDNILTRASLSGYAHYYPWCYWIANIITYEFFTGIYCCSEFRRKDGIFLLGVVCSPDKFWLFKYQFLTKLTPFERYCFPDLKFKKNNSHVIIFRDHKVMEFWNYQFGIKNTRYNSRYLCVSGDLICLRNHSKLHGSMLFDLLNTLPYAKNITLFSLEF